MATIKDEIVINASREFVFGFVSDYTNDLKWREGVIGMKCSTKENIFLGTRTRETMKFLGSTFITVARVTEYSPFTKIAFRSVAGKFPVHGYRQIDGVEGYSKFTYSLTIELSGFAKIFNPLLKSIYKKRIQRDLVKLKSILEPAYINKLENYSEYKIPFGFYS